MKSELLSLIQDTKQLIARQLPPKQEPQLKQQAPTTLLPKPVVEKKPPQVAEAPPKTPPKQIEAPSQGEDMAILTLIGKHLPHLKLIDPQAASSLPVGILVFDEKELPFLKNLAGAIQKGLCPAKLIDAGKLLAEGKWDSFFREKRYSLLLTQKNGPATYPLIPLLSSDEYAAKPDEKKKLWALLCQTLSPKSS